MNKAKYPAIVVLSIVMFLLFCLDFITGGMLSNLFGIVPRNTNYLLGIIMHPFAHGDIGHFINNIIPFVVLGFFLGLSFSNKEFYFLFFALTIMTGGFVWLFGGSGLHIGASGVIFGMWSSVLTLGIIRRNIKDIIAAILVVVIFGSTFFIGLIPKEQVSFSGHFFGVVSGIILSLLIVKFEKHDQEKEQIL